MGVTFKDKPDQAKEKCQMCHHLPFGSEFSPSQIDLPTLLDIALNNEGSNATLQSAIRQKFFSSHGGENASNQATLALNCRLGMKAYGLIDKDGGITDFGRELYSLKDSEEKLYKRLAKHILQNLLGMSLLRHEIDFI